MAELKVDDEIYFTSIEGDWILSTIVKDDSIASLVDNSPIK